MIVVAGGDSFVFGSELQDCGPHYSLSTFPALLSKDIGQYVCVAWPGYGNDGIARSVIQKCERLKDQEKVVIVSWTFPGRYEFRYTYDTQQRNSPWYTITPWTTATIDTMQKEFVNTNSDVLAHHIESTERAKNTGVADFAKVFYQHVGSSEYWEIYSTLKEIVYLQNYLKINNIPYLFTCADNCIFNNYTCNNADDTIKSLTDQIWADEDNWFWFPAGVNPQDTCEPRGFYQWAVENKYSIGTTHPLEQAHQDASKLIKDKFDEMVTKSVQQD